MSELLITSQNGNLDFKIVFGGVGEDFKNQNSYYDQGIIKRGEKWFPAGENLFWDLNFRS